MMVTYFYSKLVLAYDLYFSNDQFYTLELAYYKGYQLFINFNMSFIIEVSFFFEFSVAYGSFK